MLKHDEIFQSPVKQLLREKKKTLGAWSQFGSPAVVEAMASTGLDWIVIDMEHGPSDLSGIIAQMQAMKGYGCYPIVRAPGNDIIWLKKVLDAGVYGVHIPYLFGKEDFEKAVRACKYPPKGCRGASSTGRASGYSINPLNYLKYADEEILVLGAIETKTAAENIEEILTVEGLDGVFIGPMDLATDMGYFASPTAPEVQEMVKKVEAATLASGKILAGTCNGFDNAKKKFDAGYTLVYGISDVFEVGSQTMALVKSFKEEYPER